MGETVILTCGWCRSVIPSDDEVQHHFFVTHGRAVGQSVRYHYPERVGDDLEHWLASSPAVPGAGEEGR
jgi:hypothetical protein